MVGCQGLRVGGRKSDFLFKGYRVSAGEEEKVLEMEGGDVTRTTMYLNVYFTTLFKWS